jgi:hypothetical protein
MTTQTELTAALRRIAEAAPAPQPLEELIEVRVSAGRSRGQRSHRFMVGSVAVLGLVVGGLIYLARRDNAGQQLQPPLAASEDTSLTEGSAVMYNENAYVGPTISSADVQSLYVLLSSEYPNQFGGVHVDEAQKAVVVTATSDDSETLQLLASAIQRVRATPGRLSALPDLPISIRTAAMTFAEIKKLLADVGRGKWLPDGSSRYREAHWDDANMVVVVSLWRPTSADQEAADVAFDHRVVVAESSAETPAQQWPAHYELDGPASTTSSP